MNTRRQFLTGLGSLVVAAPAIVHAGNLMPIKPLEPWFAPAGFTRNSLRKTLTEFCNDLAKRTPLPDYDIVYNPDTKMINIFYKPFPPIDVIRLKQYLERKYDLS